MVFNSVLYVLLAVIRKWFRYRAMPLICLIYLNVEGLETWVGSVFICTFTSSRTISDHSLPYTALTYQVPGVLTGLATNDSRVPVTSKPRMRWRSDILASSNCKLPST